MTRTPHSRLHQALLRAATPGRPSTARQLQQSADIEIPTSCLHVSCARLVQHACFTAEGQGRDRRYRRTDRGTAYLRVLDIALPLRLCRTLEQVGTTPLSLRAVAGAALVEGERLQQGYNNLRDLSALDLIEITGARLSKQVQLTPLGEATLLDAAFVVQFWAEAS